MPSLSLKSLGFRVLGRITRGSPKGSKILTTPTERVSVRAVTCWGSDSARLLDLQSALHLRSPTLMITGPQLIPSLNSLYLDFVLGGPEWL